MSSEKHIFGKGALRKYPTLHSVLVKIKRNIHDIIELRSLHRENTFSKEQLKAIKRAYNFGYLPWPKKIKPYIYEKEVLDVGCGTGLHSIGFLVYGADKYTGLDPRIDYTNAKGKNLRKRKFENFGLTPNQIKKLFPQVDFIRGNFEDIAPNKKFDIAVLHNVTEHLHNLEKVLDGIKARLNTNGIILFNHHNFFCWNGHHQMPKTINDINMKDEKQLEYIDWSHLNYADSSDDKLSKKLNKISLDQLHYLTEKYYDIVVWNEIPSGHHQGVNRLTDNILNKYHKYTKRDLTVQHVFCVAKLKS